jgi:hypothetical protein
VAGLVNDSDTQDQLRLDERLPPLRSVVAGMVDLIGFFYSRQHLHGAHHPRSILADAGVTTRPIAD